MKLSPGVLILALVLGTAFGPLSTLAELPDGALADTGYWQDVLAETIRSFANAGLTVIGVVAAGLGLPALRARREP